MLMPKPLKSLVYRRRRRANLAVWYH